MPPIKGVPRGPYQNSPKTEEERLERRRQAKARYKQSERGKRVEAAYLERSREHRRIADRKRRLRREYGITTDEYQLLLESQAHRCAICKRHETELKRRMAVDHCHKSGKIRGLLCWRCNGSIGKFEDDAGLLEVAIRYLRGNDAETIHCNEK